MAIRILFLNIRLVNKWNELNNNTAEGDFIGVQK